MFLVFRKLEYGFYILFADLFVDSFGYVFAWNRVSLRVAMAGVLLTVVLFRIARDATKKEALMFEKLEKFIRRYRSLSAAYALLMFWLGSSFLHGWIANGFQNAFQDFNGLLLLSFLPLLLFVSMRLNNLFNILKAALLWQFMLVSVVELVFSRWGVVPVLYTFIRDNRFGEITPAFGNFYRIFLQSEVYAVVGLLIAMTSILLNKNRFVIAGGLASGRHLLKQFSDYTVRHADYVLLFISTVLLLMSLSRSFWVGTAVALMVGIVTMMMQLIQDKKSMYLLDTVVSNRYTFRKPLFVKTSFRSFSMIAITVVLSIVYVAFISSTGFGTSRVVKDRTTISEAAASSRQAQLKPLHNAILQSPIIGYGFGKELEYRSADPRRIAESGGTGVVWTWAFELGWHDLILKTGIIGALLYLLFIILLMKMLWFQAQSSKLKAQSEHSKYKLQLLNDPITELPLTPYPLPVIFFLSLVAIVVIHAFTPYLNHPLGIGVILLATLALSTHNIGLKTPNVVS